MWVYSTPGVQVQRYSALLYSDVILSPGEVLLQLVFRIEYNYLRGMGHARLSWVRVGWVGAGGSNDAHGLF